jgi:hypothetical protein
MVLTPEQNLSILISLSESLVAAPERHEELFEITETGPGESAALTKSVGALRARFAGFAPSGSERERMSRLRAIADELEASPDADEQFVGHTLSVMVERRAVGAR